MLMLDYYSCKKSTFTLFGGVDGDGVRLAFAT